jgi:Flp pilus assembly protein TadD
LGAALLEAGDPTGAEAVLREAQRQYPGDVWLNHTLARCLERLGRREEAIRYYMAARSLRPETAHDLAHALEQKGETDRAITVFQDVARLRPRDGRNLACLGEALQSRGRTQEAKAALDAAIIASRAAIAVRPDPAEAHLNLGNALRDQGKLGEAIAEFREAVRRMPESSTCHNNLGVALNQQGKLEDAIAEFRAALRLRPDYPDALNNLGGSFGAQGKFDEAIAEFGEALRLKPDYPEAHNNLGLALARQGKVAEAIAEFRAALRLKPEYPQAHCNLGTALRREARFAESLTELKRGHELGSKNPRWHYPSARWVQEAERLVELDAKLPAVLSGKLKPANAVEMLGFAQLCYEKQLHGASARLWTEAFQAQPKLADDMQAAHRYNPACAAARAGCGQGKDDPPLDEATRARWRKQALDWLQADLTAWSKLLASGTPQARQSIPQTLQHWKADPDLAGIRDPAALAKLPEDEQKTCRRLWAEVDALLAKARGGTAP